MHGSFAFSDNRMFHSMLRVMHRFERSSQPFTCSVYYMGMSESASIPATLLLSICQGIGLIDLGVDSYLLATACSRACLPCCSKLSSLAAPLWVAFSSRILSKSFSAAAKSQVDRRSLPLHCNVIGISTHYVDLQPQHLACDQADPYLSHAI